MKTHLSKSRPADGFALVATILLMVLLAIITIGTLSLSAVSIRSGNQDSAQARARANARMALMIAIGELQKQMGPDQRISANSDILTDDPSAIRHRHWLGAWDSWKAGSGEDSQHSTIQGVSDEMAPTYLPNRSDRFRKWLVSLNEGEMSSISSPLNLNLQASNLPSDQDDAIFLVSQGSLGDDANDPADFAAARLLDIKDLVSSETTGRYGWWVGDESLKARVMDDSYLEDSSLTSADRIFRGQAPASMGSKTIRGLENIQNDADLGKLPSLNTLDLVSGAVERPAQKNFHHITSHSQSLLTDVREGGLKRDLSTLLERSVPNPIDPDVSKREQSNDFMLYKFSVKDAWANDPTKYPTLPITPQECVPIHDLTAFYQLYDKSRRGGIEYTSDKIQVVNPDYGTPTTYTTAFQRDYTTLYRNPVPIKIQFLLSLAADPITPADRALVTNASIPASDTHKLRLAVVPAVTMWNPYNVPIVMQSGSTRAQQIIYKPPLLNIRIRKILSNGSIYQYSSANNGRWMHFEHLVTGGYQGRSDIIRLNFARTSPIVFQPGEVRVFSAPTSVKYLRFGGNDPSGQNLSSAKNLIDAVPGWNPNAILTLKNSSNGRGGNSVDWPHVVTETTSALDTRSSLSMNANSATEAIDITVSPETQNGTWLRTWPQSELTSPRGAAFSFYMAQRNFSAEGNPALNGNKGYGFLNVRHMSLVSRFGGGRSNRNNIPRLFNEQLYSQGAANITLGLPMEPIPVASIVNAANAGESVPFMQLSLMAGSETSEMANGGLNGGRKFPSRPFMHSSAFQPNVIDQNDGTAPYNHGWNWWIDEMNSVLESMVQESKDGNGYYGGGFTPESGVTQVVQQEIPVTPPISIAALSHARLGGFTLANEVPVAHGFTGEMMEGLDGAEARADNPSPTLGFQRVTATGQGGLYPHVLQAIGNSYANPNLLAGVAYNPDWKRLYDVDDGERTVTFADHSYLANKALWDDYFFSSITPQSSTIEIFGTSNRDAKKVASEFFFNGKPLPNRRMLPYKADMNSTELDALFASKSDFTGGLADKIAGHLMVEGGFNINSTSVDAWKVFFSSLKGKPIAYLDTGKVPQEAATGNTVPISMATLPNGLPASTADTEDPRDPAQWKGLRGISEDEIDALAQAMVREVKKRGPFLSMSDFINRRLDPNNTDGVALKGALQAALDYDGADGKGPEVTINKNFRDPSRKLDNEVGSIDFSFDDAARGPAAYGSSAYVDQADVLRQFAEQLTPRGDTFVIRTYGDALDKNGKVLARAWCEAVVQRTPDYVDDEDENHTKAADLDSEANKKFGRKIEIISFRWLNSSEV